MQIKLHICTYCKIFWCIVKCSGAVKQVKTKIYTSQGYVAELSHFYCILNCVAWNRTTDQNQIALDRILATSLLPTVLSELNRTGLKICFANTSILRKYVSETQWSKNIVFFYNFKHTQIKGRFFSSVDLWCNLTGKKRRIISH